MNSAWTYQEERKQFYLHQYLPEQPDLNYRNPLVVEEMKNVLMFWLELGVDGFRQDTVIFSLISVKIVPILINPFSIYIYEK